MGEAGNTACGDTVRIELELADGRIARARHRCLRVPARDSRRRARLCGWREGRDPARGGRDRRCPTSRRCWRRAVRNRGCVAVAVDALCAGRSRPRSSVAGRGCRRQAAVAVAMSGGVDAAVALLKAVEAGLEPVGVTLRLWIDPGAPDGERACCSPQSVRAARAACHALGVPHVGLDLREEFRRGGGGRVRRPATRAGRTPNPCMRCNGAFRFDGARELRRPDRGRRGSPPATTPGSADRGGSHAGGPGADPAKDQSYMLAGVPAEILARCWFPLGEQTKAGDARAGTRRRAWRRPDVPRARTCASSAAATTGRFWSATEVLGRRARSWSPDGRACSAVTTASTASRPGQRRGSAWPANEPLVRDSR